MTVPHADPVDPRLVAHLAGQLDWLGRQMDDAGKNLEVLRGQLASAQQGTRPASTYVPQTPLPAPAAPFPDPEPAAPRVPWWQRDGVISRILAVAGVAVTLVGVVMLLVLAAQVGLFGPVPRVVAGAVLSAGLLFAGNRVHTRTGGRIGGIALAATGFAGAYLDVVAVTVVYGWMHPLLGMAVALGVAAAGVGLAVTWDSQPFAVLVVLGAALLAPFVTGALTVGLLGFLLVIQLATFAAQGGRDWAYLSVARTLPAVVAAAIAVVITPASDHTTALWVAATAFSVSAFGLASSIMILRRNAADTTAAALIVLTALPTVLVGELFSHTTSIVVAGVVSAVMFGTCVAVRRLPAGARTVIAGLGALELLVCCVLWSTAPVVPMVIAALGALFFVASGQTHSRISYGIGVAYTIFGCILHLTTAPPRALVDASVAVDDLGLGVVLSGIALVVALTLMVRQAHRLGLVRGDDAHPLWLAAGAGIAYACTSAIVAMGTSISGSETGFVAGHGAATIVWMLAATAALAFGLTHRERARIALGIGLTLTAAAVAKLFLFDLATLGGVARVVAFIAVGLLLLGAGTRYAREFAEREPVTGPSGGRSVH